MITDNIEPSENADDNGSEDDDTDYMNYESQEPWQSIYIPEAEDKGKDQDTKFLNVKPVSHYLAINFLIYEKSFEYGEVVPKEFLKKHVKNVPQNDLGRISRY